MKNAFQNVIREKGLEKIWKNPELHPIFYALYRKASCSTYIGIGGGNNVHNAPYSSEEGYVQGSVESMIMTCLTTDAANKEVNKRLRLSGGMLVAGADDTYLIGKLRDVLEAMEILVARLAEVGLSLHPNKTKIYVADAHRTEAFLDTIQAKNIQEGSIGNMHDGTLARDIKAFCVPFGQDSYVRRSLHLKASKIIAKGEELSTKLNPAAYPEPEFPCHQARWLLLSRCDQFQGNYLVRHVSPEMVDDFVDRVDNANIQTLIGCTGIDYEEASHFTKERLLLGVKDGGCGLKLLRDIQHTEWLGAWIQGTSTLLNTTDSNGNCRHKRAHIPGIVAMMGEGSFDTENLHKWSTLLEREDCELATGLRTVYEALQAKAARLSLSSGTDGSESLIITQPLHNYGFDSEGKAPNR